LKRIDILNLPFLYVLQNSRVLRRVQEYSSSPALKSTKVTYFFLLPYWNLGRRRRCSKELSSF
jgi:hypothetical protein